MSSSFWEFFTTMRKKNLMENNKEHKFCICESVLREYCTNNKIELPEMTEGKLSYGMVTLEELLCLGSTSTSGESVNKKNDVNHSADPWY
ncbi:hypothetical protein COOONC_21726 [Cooperia oncophora]